MSACCSALYFGYDASFLVHRFCVMCACSAAIRVCCTQYEIDEIGKGGYEIGICCFPLIDFILVFRVFGWGENGLFDLGNNFFLKEEKRFGLDI